MIFQAIETKYKNGHIVAKAAEGKVRVEYNHSLNLDENHISAAKALIEKLSWKHKGDFSSGVLKDETYVHVFKE